jgi:hypothetical protein
LFLLKLGVSKCRFGADELRIGFHISQNKRVSRHSATQNPFGTLQAPLNYYPGINIQIPRRPSSKFEKNRNRSVTCGGTGFQPVHWFNITAKSRKARSVPCGGCCAMAMPRLQFTHNLPITNSGIFQPCRTDFVALLGQFGGLYQQKIRRNAKKLLSLRVLTISIMF